MSDAYRRQRDQSRQNQSQSRDSQSRDGNQGRRFLKPAVTEADPTAPHRQTFATYHAVSYIGTAEGFEIDPDQTITEETNTLPGAGEGEGEGSGEPATAPPVNRDVPAVSGPDGLSSASVGQTLNCTMGNWDNTPDGYSYQWVSGSTNVGAATSNNSYVVDPADVGQNITCVVTATNAIGSTTAPPSNPIAVS